MSLTKGSSGTYIIYPEYFNIQLTRADGRRVPRSLAVYEPKVEDILNISKKLGLSPVLETDRSHPSRWFRSDGRVKVIKKFQKEATLKLIAQRLPKGQ
jgi:signal recognition particle subunit SRP19